MLLTITVWSQTTNLTDKRTDSYHKVSVALHAMAAKKLTRPPTRMRLVQLRLMTKAELQNFLNNFWFILI